MMALSTIDAGNGQEQRDGKAEDHRQRKPPQRHGLVPSSSSVADR